MVFKSGVMTAASAAEIAEWQYGAPYDVYNMGGTEEAVSELMNGAYHVVTATDDLIGYYCTGVSAQVPAAGGVKPYLTPAVDIGIGMRPDLTGHGRGTAFFEFVLDELKTSFPGNEIRLTVAVFNRRAIRLYEKFGFIQEQTFNNPKGTAFQVMRMQGESA